MFGLLQKRYISAEIFIAAMVKNLSPMKPLLLALTLFVFASLAVSSEAAVVINEIMYHPASELTTEEYIELYNTGAVAVDVSGWKITTR